MAGTGKSTISRTIAHTFADQKRLGASFFFSRGQGDLGHAGKLFTTIASQLAYMFPALRRYICEAIAEDYRIGTQGLSEQWRKLIVQPLSRLESTLSHQLPIILVIDALDECEHENRKDDTQVILQLLAGARDLPTVRLRIFLTSRPEVSIHHGFSTMSDMLHQDCILHHISKDVIQHDILIFLQSEFDRMRRKRDIQADWPEEKDVHSLVKDANGLFIYAATICRFIDKRHPKKQLSLVLQLMESSPSHLGPAAATRTLDAMYSQILKSSIYKHYDEEEREEVLDLFKQTVGSIVILLDTISLEALAGLLHLPITDVDEILKLVQSVLDVPNTPDLPVRLLHPSFRDFLLDKERCLEHQFWIDKNKAHENVLKSCLELMSKTLRKDICGLRKPGILTSEVQHNLVDQHLPSALRYACCYWVYHLQQSNTVLYDNCPAHLFLQAHFLHWLEALSLIRKMSDGIHIITLLVSMIKARPHIFTFSRTGTDET
jgi:hypothetical protein